MVQGEEMAKKHYVDTNSISHVEFYERRGKGYIKFTAKIDGKKQEVEIKEEEYGRMLRNEYYEI